MRVIGTAGHVDHGKSALIEALTGTHPDRLKEEQARAMTIDLGFAWWSLPDGQEVGVVDVPGHRDFIENMLAGVGGIDAALLVIAADEGLMPQTREHLAILDLLEIPAGVVALTKIDLVSDPDWLAPVESETRAALMGTHLAAAPIVRVSAHQGTGLLELEQALQQVLAARRARPVGGLARLPVDRVFSMPGFGTVLTGTLLGGPLAVGDAVEVLPAGLTGRVRGLQNHKKQVASAPPGGRTAVNVTGIEVGEVGRGMVLAHPGAFRPTRRLDAAFRLLPEAAAPLRHDDEVKLFLGAAEVVARVRLLGVEELAPGASGWLQLETRGPLVAARGDRYILRRPSPGETLGGGAVLDPHPPGRHKRFASAALARLAALAGGEPAELVAQALAAQGLMDEMALAAATGLDAAAVQAALAALLGHGAALQVGSGAWVDAGRWAAWQARLLELLADYHTENPLRGGMPRADLQSRLGAPPAAFSALLDALAATGELDVAGPLLRQAGVAVQFSRAQQAALDALLAQFAAAPFAPPTVRECRAALGADVYQAALETGRLAQISPEVVFRPEDVAQAEADLRTKIAEQGAVTLAQMRDHWGTTRRYVQDLLQYFDGRGVTVREGDARRLKDG